MRRCCCGPPRRYRRSTIFAQRIRAVRLQVVRSIRTLPDHGRHSGAAWRRSGTGRLSRERLMAASNKIRVGIVGASASRGFASIAHIPALRALPQFEIAAVCTTRQETAQAAARHYGVALAFSDPAEMARHPDVDLVTVSVKVPDHYRPVMAAIEAGKHVYCEWPLGRDSDEAGRMLDAAERRGIRHAVGLQGRMSPAINFARDLIADGYVGRVLTATMIGCAPNWGATIDRAYQADRAQWRQPADDHRRAPDRRAVLLPRRISRADRLRGQSARPDRAAIDRRDGREELAGPARRQRHRR